jgi:predicted transcriptional regulator
MKRLNIRVKTASSFFARGRRVARLADQGRAIPASHAIACEDVESLLRVLTEERIMLLREVEEGAASIGDLARKLRRDRSAVTRDVPLLERFGVVEVEVRPFPGHGLRKVVTPIAREIRVTADL